MAGVEFLNSVLRPRFSRDHRARVPVLLADEEAWQGHVGWLELRLSPGSGRVRAATPVDASARASVEIAVSVALGPRAGRWDAWWTVELPGDLPIQTVAGDSLGLAAAVAARAALRRHRVPEGLCFTGRLDPRGEVDAVGLVALKAAAAARAGFRTLVVPPDAPDFPAPARLEVPSTDALFGHLWPERPLRRWSAVGAALLLAPALVALGVLQGADLPLRKTLLALAQEPLPASTTVLVLTAPQERSSDGHLWSFRERRARLPPLVDALVQAGVSSITLDRLLVPADPSDDALADALARAATTVPIVFVTRWRDGPILPASERLQGLIRDGTIHLGTGGFEGSATADLNLGRLVLREHSAETGWVWHAAVLTVAAWTPRARPPEWRDHRVFVAGHASWAPAARLTLRAVDPSPCLLWVEPGFTPVEPEGCRPVSSLAGRRDLAGRAALLGVRADEDRVLLANGLAYGIDAQAAAVENLAAGASLRALTLPGRMGLALLLSGVPAAIVALSAPGARPAWMAMALGVLLSGGALFLLAHLGLLPDVLPVGIGLYGAFFAGLRIKSWRDTGR